MAIFRNVNMSFWTDPKVVDDYTPEDRYFMLYAMTNQYTNIIGCYEISIKQMSNDLGYTKDVVERIINRFKEIHRTIDYDFDTKELFIKNWSKYNWSSSPKLDNHLYSFIEKIKSNLFHDEIAKVFNERETIKESDTLLIPYRYPMDTSITNTIPISIPISISNSSSIDSINRTSNRELEEEFEVIWKKYPNKKGKPNALKSYIKARKKGTPYEEVLTGLEKYVQYITIGKIEQQYIKHGSTWFNQECWNDEYTIKERQNKQPIRQEMMPEWYGKEIVAEKPSEEEIAELREMLKDFK